MADSSWVYAHCLYKGCGLNFFTWSWSQCYSSYSLCPAPQMLLQCHCNIIYYAFICYASLSSKSLMITVAYASQLSLLLRVNMTELFMNITSVNSWDTWSITILKIFYSYCKSIVQWETTQWCTSNRKHNSLALVNTKHNC